MGRVHMDPNIINEYLVNGGWGDDRMTIFLESRPKQLVVTDKLIKFEKKEE